MQEFDYSGSLTVDNEDKITMASSHSIDLNSVKVHSGQGISDEIHSSAIDFARFRYRVLFNRLDLPASKMDEDDAQHET